MDATNANGLREDHAACEFALPGQRLKASRCQHFITSSSRKETIYFLCTSGLHTHSRGKGETEQKPFTETLGGACCDSPHYHAATALNMTATSTENTQTPRKHADGQKTWRTSFLRPSAPAPQGETV